MFSAAGSKELKLVLLLQLQLESFLLHTQVEKLTWRKRHEMKIPANVFFMYALLVKD